MTRFRHLLAALVAASVLLAGCDALHDVVITYGAKGAEIQAERAVAEVHGLPAKPLPYGSPEIDNALASIKARWPQIKPLLADGTLGLTEDGEIAMHDSGARDRAAMRSLRALVRAENRDRFFLYRGVTAAIGHGGNTLPMMIGHTEDVFARQWYEQAPKGWWIQDHHGRWLQK